MHICKQGGWMRRHLFFLSALIIVVCIIAFAIYGKENDYEVIDGTLLEFYDGGFSVRDLSGSIYKFSCNYGVNVSDLDIGEKVCVTYKKEGLQYYAQSVLISD